MNKNTIEIIRELKNFKRGMLFFIVSVIFIVLSYSGFAQLSRVDHGGTMVSLIPPGAGWSYQIKNDHTTNDYLIPHGTPNEWNKFVIAAPGLLISITEACGSDPAQGLYDPGCNCCRFGVKSALNTKEICPLGWEPEGSWSVTGDHTCTGGSDGCNVHSGCTGGKHQQCDGTTVTVIGHGWLNSGKGSTVYMDGTGAAWCDNDCAKGCSWSWPTCYSTILQIGCKKRAGSGPWDGDGWCSGNCANDAECACSVGYWCNNGACAETLTTGGTGDTGTTTDCLLYDTLVLMSDGSYKTIQTVEIGEIVRAMDVNGNVIGTKVLDILRDHQRSNYYIINSELKITDDHPMAVLNDYGVVWVPVEELKIGDKIQSASGTVEIRSIEFADVPAITAQLMTEAGNFLVKGGNGGVYTVKGWNTY